MRLRDLIACADVFGESFRRGVMARLGFDYESVRAIRPDIVYCSISAFGQEGALSHHPAHDMAVQALAGFLSVNGGPEDTPVVPGTASADLAAGLTGLSAVLMALVGRERSGERDRARRRSGALAMRPLRAGAPIRAAREREKPGFMRVNFPGLMSDAECERLVGCVEQLADDPAPLARHFVADYRTAVFAPAPPQPERGSASGMSGPGGG